MQQYKTIRSLTKKNYAGKIRDQSNLVNDYLDFKKRTKPRDKERKKAKNRYYWNYKSIL